jgi:hypothetical protein
MSKPKFKPDIWPNLMWSFFAVLPGSILLFYGVYAVLNLLLILIFHTGWLPWEFWRQLFFLPALFSVLAFFYNLADDYDNYKKRLKRYKKVTSNES